MKQYIILGLVLVLLAGLWVFRSRLFPTEIASGSASGLQVAVTNPSLEVIVKEVGGSEISVKVVTENQQSVIAESDALVFLGNDTDAWADTAAKDLAKRGIVPVKALTGSDGNVPKDLTPEVKKQLASRLAHLFGVLDPEHANRYSANSNQYTATVK